MQKYCLYLFILLLSACGTRQIADYSSGTTEINAEQESSSLDSIINPYREEMRATMNVKIGYTNQSLEKYTPESPLGNFSADVMLEAGLKYANNQADIDSNLIKNTFCLLNFGGLRSTVNQGDISVGNVYELMPFDNTLTLVQLSASKLSDMLDYLKKVQGQPISGAKIDLSGDHHSIVINGREFDKESDVLIVTSDYLAGGGDKMEFFKGAKNSWNSGILMRDIYIEHIKKVGELKAYPVENRIKLN